MGTVRTPPAGSILNRRVVGLSPTRGAATALDGSEVSATEDLVCAGDAVITLTRNSLQPSQDVTLRWEASRAPFVTPSKKRSAAGML
jgi:hypothetical protein